MVPAVTALAALFVVAGGPTTLLAQERPMFTAVARLVPLSVTVRDDNGRPVTGLTKDDFEVLSDDERRPLQQFQSEASPITVALLMDRSGSMRVSSRAAAANEAAHHLVSWMSPKTDRVALFAFDTTFTQTSAFNPVAADSLSSLMALAPYGATSLYDALDLTSEALVRDGAPRRAVVAITDGVDTSSVLTAAQVTARAATIDVPVYIIAIALEVDEETGNVETAATQSELAQVTERTGGQLFQASAPAHASKAARTIVTELRQQYLLAFTPDPRPGWHRLTVRTKQHHKTVRARAGYVTR